ncbi:MAG: sialate O-acetylesterase, partial [Verrucomicrobiota bacterium]
MSAWGPNGWQPAKDPQPGASGDGGSFLPPLGDRLAQELGVPVGFVAVGSGGTSVREWLPAGVPFDAPPTVMSRVRRVGHAWEADGALYAQLAARVRELGPRGFRAVLWHQGESDANQADPTRTLPGVDYARHLSRVIEGIRSEAGWPVPWMVAQASYHTPDDRGSEDIRAAQASLARSGLALAGPDTDALGQPWREGGGRGVHFSGAGLREHGRLWAERLGPWIRSTTAAGPRGGGKMEFGPAPGWLALKAGRAETFLAGGRPAFVFLPEKREARQPWVFYAPNLPGLPDEAERWMHEQFLAAGVAVAGVDVGEAYGSPGAQEAQEALYRVVRRRFGFAPKACVLGRSRGGLIVAGWAGSHPERVSGLAGIYPVFDVRSYPGLARAAGAYGLGADELSARLARLNPVARAG